MAWPDWSGFQAIRGEVRAGQGNGSQDVAVNCTLAGFICHAVPALVFSVESFTINRFDLRAYKALKPYRSPPPDHRFLHWNNFD